MQRTLQDVSQVDRLAPSGLKYLLTATESIGDDQHIRLRPPHRRQEDSPIACDTAYLSFSKPNGPAIPQHPASTAFKSEPILRSNASSSVILMIAL